MPQQPIDSGKVLKYAPASHPRHCVLHRDVATVLPWAFHLAWAWRLRDGLGKHTVKLCSSELELFNKFKTSFGWYLPQET